jgi:hypothetical protein
MGGGGPTLGCQAVRGGGGVWCCVRALGRQRHGRGEDGGACSAWHRAMSISAKQGWALASGERRRWSVGRSGDRKMGRALFDLNQISKLILTWFDKRWPYLA